MEIDMGKVTKYQSKGKKNSSPSKVHIAFTKGEEAYEIIQELRKVGIEGSTFKNLLTDLLRDAVTKQEKKSE